MLTEKLKEIQEVLKSESVSRRHQGTQSRERTTRAYNAGQPDADEVDRRRRSRGGYRYDDEFIIIPYGCNNELFICKYSMVVLFQMIFCRQ